MALPISTFSVVEVGKPNVGENRPSRVRADITIELNVADSVKMEWEGKRVWMSVWGHRIYFIKVDLHVQIS